jgi:hypothetical protein
MKPWSLALVEGSHEVEFLSSLLEVGAGWKKSRDLHGLPNPRHARHLEAAHHRLVLVPMSGADNLLGASGEDLLKNTVESASSVILVLDADHLGVETRVEQVRELWRRAQPDQRMNPMAGRVVRGSPSCALWVAPDCSRNGSLDALILEAAQKAEPERTRMAREFIEHLQSTRPEGWGQHLDKATLGALGQRYIAGASLAVALQTAKAWLDEDAARTGVIGRFLAFIEEATDSTACR